MLGEAPDPQRAHAVHRAVDNDIRQVMKGEAERPRMPGYGLMAPEGGQGLLPWSFVAERMQASRNYWVVTVGDRHQPHATPVWGLWHNQQFYFAAGADSRKVTNLARNSSLLVHLESGDEVVILEGIGRQVEAEALLEELNAIYLEKYGVDMSAGLVFSLEAKKALAWRERDFPSSATRWRLDD